MAWGLWPLSHGVKEGEPKAWEIKQGKKGIGTLCYFWCVDDNIHLCAVQLEIELQIVKCK